MQYIVLIPCRNDASGRAYEPGELVTGKDFPAGVIENWLEIGVLGAVALIADEEQENGGND